MERIIKKANQNTIYRKTTAVVLGMSMILSLFPSVYAVGENDVDYINTAEFVDFDYAFEGIMTGYGEDNSFNGTKASKAGERGVPCFWNNGGNYSLEYQTKRSYMNNYVVSTGGKNGIIYVGEIEDVQAVGSITVRGSSSGSASTYKIYAMDTSDMDFSIKPDFGSNAILLASGTMNAAASSWHTKVDDNPAQMENFSASGAMGIFIEISAASGANYDGMSFGMKNIYNVTNLSAVAGDGEVRLLWTPPISDLVTDIKVSCYKGTDEVKSEIISASEQEYIFDSLENGTEYTFYVSSEYDGAGTPETISAMPYKFEGLNSVYGEQNKNRICLSWELPQNVVYSDIIIYDNNKNKIAVLQGDQTEYSITNAKNESGDYKYYVVVADEHGNTAESEIIVSYSEYIPKDVSIRDFTYTAIGAYEGGEYTEDPESGIITLNGTSSDISTGSKDDTSLDYVYIPIDHTSLIEDGDTVSISANIADFPLQENQTNQFKNIKAGLMYRNNKDMQTFDSSGAASVNMFVSPASTELASDPYRLMYSYRSMSGNPAQITDVNMSSDDYSYMKLEGTKNGNDLVFRFYYSADGENWTDSEKTYTETDALNSAVGYYGLFIIGKDTAVHASFGDIRINGKAVDFEAPKEHDVTRIDAYPADSGVKLAWVAPKSNENILVTWEDGALELPSESTECEINNLQNNKNYEFMIKTVSEDSEGAKVSVTPLELKSAVISGREITKQYAKLSWQLPSAPNRSIINRIRAEVINNNETIYSEDLDKNAVSFTTKDKLQFETDTDYTVVISTIDILGNEREIRETVRYDYDGSPLAKAYDRKVVFTWNESYALYNQYEKLNFYIGDELAASAAMSDKRAALAYLVNGDEYRISIRGEKNGVETDLNDTAVVTPVGNIKFDAVGIGGATAEAQTTDGILTLKVTNGNDMWSIPDKFAYYCIPASGDISMTIRVEKYGSNNSSWSRQGLMIRETLESDSRFVGAGVVPYNSDYPYGVAREVRTTEDSTAVRDEIKGTVHEGEYLRMTKVGNYIYTEVSVDGINWTDKTQKQMGFKNDSFYIGITKAKDDTDGFRISEIYIDNQNIYSPEPVQNLYVEGVSDGGAVIAWDAPSGDSDLFDSYIVTWTDKSGEQKRLTVDKSERRCSVTGLENNNTYNIEVKTAYHNKKYSSEKTVSVTPYSLADPAVPTLIINGGTTINKGETKSFTLTLDKAYTLKTLKLKFALSSSLTLHGFEKEINLNGFNAEMKDNTIIFTSATGKAESIHSLGTLKISAANTSSTAQKVSISGEAEYFNELQNSASPSKTILLDEKVLSLSISTPTNSPSGSNGGGGGGGASSGNTSSGSTGISNSSSMPQKYFGEGNDVFNETAPVTKTDQLFIDETDIPSWAEEAVKELYKRNAISGIDYNGKTAFAPNEYITREAFVKILIGAIGTVDNNAACEFSDVNIADWYYPYIATACEMGVVNGKDDGSFGIGENISRQDMAVMLVRAIDAYKINKKTVNSAIKFSDNNMIAAYAVDAVSFVQQAGIMNGTSDDIFEPNSTATRAMAATVIYRIIK